jgi:23S rRNA pseudouridine1911/1915/1917 synthase
MRVLYEDAALIVCEKPAGVLSQPDVSGQGEDMLSLLRDHLGRPQDGKEPYVGLVHRLDRGVGGVMVFAKQERANAALSTAVANRQAVKQYLAVVHGCPAEREGILRDLLYKDSAKGKTFVVDRERKGVKAASLAYRVLDTRTDTPFGEISLVQIRLHTGRTHQIRVQFSSRGHALVGDGKYGARDHSRAIGLYSYRLRVPHPMRRGETVDVFTLPSEPPFDCFLPISPCEEIPGEE